jgi:hypothetical protein
VREVNADLFRDYNPWDRISEPDAVRSMLSGAGIGVQEVVSEHVTQILSSAEDWWPMVLGTGYRGTIENSIWKVAHRFDEITSSSSVKPVSHL